jgi:hypothetical protein
MELGPRGREHPLESAADVSPAIAACSPDDAVTGTTAIRPCPTGVEAFGVATVTASTAVAPRRARDRLILQR